MRNLKDNNIIPQKAVTFLIFVLGLFFYSCNNESFDSEQELMEYIQDEPNGYIQHKIVNEVEYSLMYRPTDLLVKQEIGNEKVTKDRIKELRDKYNDYMYFNLSMSKNNQELLSTAPKNRNEFGAMVNRLAFGMEEKIHLFTSRKDTLELADFVYPRMYGMGRATTIMFVYPKEEVALEEEELNFTIEDLGLYTGEVKFKISTKIINNEPTLVF